MGRLELEIVLGEVEKISSQNVFIGGPVLMKINNIRKILEPEGYSIGMPPERHRNIPKKIIINHPTKTYNEIYQRFYECDKQI